MLDIINYNTQKVFIFVHITFGIWKLLLSLRYNCDNVSLILQISKTLFYGLYTKIGVLLHFYSVFRIIHEKVRVSELQYSIFLRSYLKIRERKKLERKKVRAQPLCHLNNPPTNPFELLDISMLLYHKETGHLDGEAKLV